MRSALATFSAGVLLLFGNLPLRAWGPHWDITRAAIDTLPAEHVLRKQLGNELLALTNYCWIPDYKGLPFRTSDQDFYADDYLLFPGMSRHLDHICPEVEQTFAPYFRRAFRALQSESQANAARWLGSLLHFVQDAGSPPHAARYRGSVHIRMENWIERPLIRIPGYVPQLLGTNADHAVQGLTARMNRLIAFSKERGENLRTPVLLANRRKVEPIVLESALECAKVTADVLHTCATLAEKQALNGFDFRGKINGVAAISDGRFPARIIFNGTNVATLAEPNGGFVVRGVPPGRVQVTIIQPGNVTLTTNVVVTNSMANLVFSLEPDHSLVRNGDFRLRWIATNAPEFWTKAGNIWNGEVVSLRQGWKYRISAVFHENSQAEVTVRTSGEHPFVVPRPTKLPPIKTRQLTKEKNELTVTGAASLALLQLMIRAPDDPTNHLKSVSVIPVSD
jgi:hypothetical protein